MTPVVFSGDLQRSLVSPSVADFGYYTAARAGIGLQTSKPAVACGVGARARRAPDSTARRAVSRSRRQEDVPSSLPGAARSAGGEGRDDPLIGFHRGRATSAPRLLQGGVAESSRASSHESRVRVATRRHQPACRRRRRRPRHRHTSAKQPLEDSDLAMHAFGPDEMILVASPEFMPANGEPKTLEDYRRMPTLSMGGADELDLGAWSRMMGAPPNLIHLPAPVHGTISSRCGARRCEGFGSRTIHHSPLHRTLGGRHVVRLPAVA